MRRCCAAPELNHFRYRHQSDFTHDVASASRDGGSANDSFASSTPRMFACPKKKQGANSMCPLAFDQRCLRLAIELLKVGVTTSDLARPGVPFARQGPRCTQCWHLCGGQ